jgi:hypothetical protein
MVLITRIVLVGTLAALGLGLLAIVVKGGGTTARINEIGYLFVPSFLLAVGLLISRHRLARRTALMLLVASVFGIALPFYLQATGALVDYEMMLHGKQVASEYPVAWITLFAGGVALAIAVAYHAARPSASGRG